SDIGEFIEGIMNSRVGAAPAPPAASCPKDPDRPWQVIGRIPVIERCPVTRIGHFGADHETALSHGGFLQKPAIEPCREKYRYQAWIDKRFRITFEDEYWTQDGIGDHQQRAATMPKGIRVQLPLKG